jgi:hypothetical protein
MHPAIACAAWAIASVSLQSGVDGYIQAAGACAMNQE